MRQLGEQRYLRGYGAALLAAARNRFSLTTHHYRTDDGRILALSGYENYNMDTC